MPDRRCSDSKIAGPGCKSFPWRVWLPFFSRGRGIQLLSRAAPFQQIIGRLGKRPCLLESGVLNCRSLGFTQKWPGRNSNRPKSVPSVATMSREVPWLAPLAVRITIPAGEPMLACTMRSICLTTTSITMNSSGASFRLGRNRQGQKSSGGLQP